MTSKCYFAVEGSWLDPWVFVHASCSAFIVRSFFLGGGGFSKGASVLLR